MDNQTNSNPYDNYNEPAGEASATPAENNVKPESGEYHFSGAAATGGRYGDGSQHDTSRWSDPVIDHIDREHANFYSPNYHYESSYTEPKKEKKKKKKTGFTFAKALCLVLACVILSAAASGAVVSVLLNRNASSAPQASTSSGKTEVVIGSSAANSSDSTATQAQTAVQVTGKELTPNEIYQLGCSQVVGVTTEVITQNVFGQESKNAVSGTGFIISEDGYILTNYHVVEYSAVYGYALKVMTYDNETYSATVVGYDESNDVAVIKIDAQNLNPVTFGNSDTIQVGEDVHAIGNPLGELTFSMTSGTVSALDRVIQTEADISINMFQIDAAINSGNSGGPIYNNQGEVIGIATAKYASSGVEGLCFAIPINDAVKIAEKVIEKGGVLSNAYLGIAPKDIEEYVVQYYNLPQGVYVDSVSDGYCAQEAGMQAGDIILSIDGTAIPNVTKLRSVLKMHEVGETVEIEVYRSGQTLTLNVTLDEAPEDTTTTQQPQQQIQQFSFGQ